ncbi:hypothetical protein BZZ08_07097 [Streptomyces sp. MH60]|nr:hypothetical protein BZZ08_07097 [Streptomyces sp. MH60]
MREIEQPPPTDDAERYGRDRRLPAVPRRNTPDIVRRRSRGTSAGTVRQPDWELSFSAPQPCQRSTSIQALTRGRSRFGYGLPV